MSQPELGAHRVSLRHPNWPKGGPMDLLDITGLNISQEAGGKGWNHPSGAGAGGGADIGARAKKSVSDPGWSKVR